MRNYITIATKFTKRCSHCKCNIKEGEQMVNLNKLLSKQYQQVHLKCWKNMNAEVMSEMPENSWFDGGDISGK